MKSRKTRAYDNRARLAKAEERKRRIMLCTAELMRERDFAPFTLEEVAKRADTTVQTILRTFGSKDALFTSALSSHGTTEVDRITFDSLEDGDVDGALATIFGIYDQIGDSVIRSLGEEYRFSDLKEANEVGRNYHRDWVTKAFAAHLDPLPEGPRREMYFALLAATDIYVWQILRRDEGLSADAALAVVHRIVTAIIEGD